MPLGQLHLWLSPLCPHPLPDLQPPAVPTSKGRQPKCTAPARTQPTSSSRVCPTQRPPSPHSLLTHREPAISKPGCTPLSPASFSFTLPTGVSGSSTSPSLRPKTQPSPPSVSHPLPPTRALWPPHPGSIWPLPAPLSGPGHSDPAGSDPDSSAWARSVPAGHSAATLWAQDHLCLPEPAWSSLGSSHRLTGNADLVSRTESTLAERKGSGRHRRRKTIPWCHMKPGCGGPLPLSIPPVHRVWPPTMPDGPQPGSLGKDLAEWTPPHPVRPRKVFLGHQAWLGPAVTERVSS